MIHGSPFFLVDHPDSFEDSYELEENNRESPRSETDSDDRPLIPLRAFNQPLESPRQDSEIQSSDSDRSNSSSNQSSEKWQNVDREPTPDSNESFNVVSEDSDEDE